MTATNFPTQVIGSTLGRTFNGCFVSPPSWRYLMAASQGDTHKRNGIMAREREEKGGIE